MEILTTFRDINILEYFKYIKNKKGSYNQDSPEYWLIHLNALRAEKATTIRGSFEEEFNSIIKNQESSNVNFYYYKTNFYNYIQQYSELSLIQTEDCSSIIDRYETLIFIIQYYLCKISNDTTPQWLCKIIQDLYFIIGDIRLSNTMLYLGFANNINIKEKDSEYCKLIDIYSAQQYGESREYAKELLIKYPNLFDIYKIYSLSCIYTNNDIDRVFSEEKCIGQMALRKIFNILSKKEDISEDVNVLQNFYLSLGKISWAVKCYTFINNETSIYTKNFRCRLFSSLYDTVLFPRIIRLIKQKEKLQAIIQSPLYHLNKNVKFLLYIQAKCNEFNDLHIDYRHTEQVRDKIVYAQVLKSLKKYELAYNIYNEISDNISLATILKLPHNDIKLTHGKMRCLVELGKLNEALTLVTNKILKHSNYLLKLKYTTLLNIIKDGPTKDIKQNICTPIYLNFYNEDDNTQWSALADFMDENEIKYPHEIPSLQNFNIETKKYLLRYICSKEVLKYDYIFNSYKKVLEECILIQKILIGIDNENESYYKNRIVSLTLEKDAKKISQDLNIGKLRVNIDGLTQDNRYRELRKKYMQFIEILYNIKSSFENTKTYDRNSLINLKRTVLVIMFKQMFLEIKDIFVFDKDYGFDLYLGTRIRHGWIQSVLRAVFDKYKLITIIDSNTSKYLDNENWNTLSENKEFQLIMSLFSFNIDETINELYERILKIKTDKIPVALFNYDFTDAEIESVENIVWEKLINFNDDTFHIIFEIIIDVIKDRTNQNIEQVKNYISNTSLVRILKELDDLTTEIEGLSGVNSYDMEQINKAIINCKGEVQNKVIEIKSWFSFSKDADIEPFSVKDTIQACQHALYQHVNFKRIFVAGDVKDIKGKYFHTFCDIFQILFNNAIKHSELKSKDVVIEVEIKEENSYLIILIMNNLSKSINIKERKEIIEQILNEAYDIDKTNNSGLARIKKLMEKEMQLDRPQLCFKLEEDNGRFNKIEFIIKIDKKQVYYYEHINN